MHKLLKPFILFLLCLLLLGCNTSESETLSGRILLWHSWNDQETEILRTILAKYSEINPDIRVISAKVPPSQLRSRYKNTAVQGLGPDLLIASSEWVRPFADEGLIKSINCHLLDDPNFTPDTSLCMADTDRYLPNALESLRYRDNLYGLPLSLQPEALYYNKNLVSSPASTLDELLLQASEGKRVAFNTSFDAAFWGIQAFGGKLFDEEGRVILDQGGFANWLGWLKNAQSTPGMILSRDDVTLRNLFIDEQAAYYIATPDVLHSLTDALGEDAVGVVPLPAGPTASAGPLLDVDAVMFNYASSTNQTRLALNLAAFLTNAEQNMILMREAQRVPANQRVRADMQAYPVMAAFAAGARTAVPTPNLAQMDRIRELGDNAYNQLLEGVIDITKVVYDLTNTINPDYGFEKVEVPEVTCQQSGRLHLWHSWQGPEAVVLTKIVENLSKDCPGVIVALTEYTTELELFDAISDTVSSNSSPHLIIGPMTWVTELSEKKLIAPITNRLDPTVQQRYIPVAVNALRLQDALYGLPISLDINALYYKKRQVNVPATLDELLTQSSAEHQVAIPTNFMDAFWGIAAFGGPSNLFDEQSRFTLGVGESGLVAWLTWLKTAQQSPGIILDNDPKALESLFTTDERVDYYIGPTSALSRTLAALEGEEIAIAPLPSTPVGEGRPLINVEAFLFGATGSGTPTDLALTFAAYATNATNQKLLIEQSLRVPANVNTILEPLAAEGESQAPDEGSQAAPKESPFPQIAGFLTQVQSAFIPAKVPQMAALRELGDTVYNAVLSEGEDPIVAGCLFNIAVNELNGFAIEDLDLPPNCPPAPPSDITPPAGATREGEAIPEEGAVPTELAPINNTPTP